MRYTLILFWMTIIHNGVMCNTWGFGCDGFDVSLNLLLVSSSRSFPTVVRSLHRHSNDSSRASRDSAWLGSALRSLCTHSCMILTVNILSLYNSPMNLIFPKLRFLAFLSCSSHSDWTSLRLSSDSAATKICSSLGQFAQISQSLSFTFSKYLHLQYPWKCKFLQI